MAHLRKIAETHVVNLREGLRAKVPDSDQIQTTKLAVYYPESSSTSLKYIAYQIQPGVISQAFNNCG